jgi:hypothetical protein
MAKIIRTIKGLLLLFFAVSFAGCITPDVPSRMPGFFLSPDQIDLEYSWRPNDTGYNEIGLYNNTSDTFRIMHPKFAVGRVFWLTDTAIYPSGSIMISPYYQPLWGFNFAYSFPAPGTYMDTLLILDAADSTHVLLSAPIALRSH